MLKELTRARGAPSVRIGEAAASLGLADAVVGCLGYSLR
jgi:hypothetical protein